MDSLRDLYSKLGEISLNGIGSLEHSEKFLEWAKSWNAEAPKGNARRILENLICPHCLKTVKIKELMFECPYCGEKHCDETNPKYEEFVGKLKNRIKKKDELLFNLASKLLSPAFTKDMMAIVYDKCNACGDPIRYISCYHCTGNIDLFAPYDRQELENRRYGQVNS